MMTTMAAIFGILPIAIGIGDGSELRQPLGVAVAGGRIVSRALALFTIPVTYIYMERLSEVALGGPQHPSPIADRPRPKPSLPPATTRAPLQATTD